MTVDALVKQLPPDTLIHLGAATAYIFIGTPAEYEAQIDALDAKYEALRDRAKLGYHKKGRARKKVAIPPWVPLRDREVKDRYMRITEGVSIIFEGEEQGPYWCREELGFDIRTARLAKGWPQQRLASYIGVSAQTISNWERGARRPMPDTLYQIKRLLR